jgi:hypothetical protein
MAEVKPRIIRADDFVAESLETEAKGMPPSYKERADILRNAAKIFRESKSTKMIRVWEEEPEKGVDFIKPDPASH